MSPIGSCCSVWDAFHTTLRAQANAQVLEQRVATLESAQRELERSQREMDKRLELLLQMVEGSGGS